MVFHYVEGVLLTSDNANKECFTKTCQEL